MLTLLFWSGGKDGAMALQQLSREGEHEVVALLTSYDAPSNTLPLHGVELQLVAAQAEQLGLPLLSVPLPPRCPNSFYEQAMEQTLERAQRGLGIEAVACGDIALQDVRDWREQFVQRLGFTSLFPLWGSDTAELAREVIANGIRAVVSGVDSSCLPEDWLGRPFDERFLAELPAGVDPCGENGEFHTFVYAMPGWNTELSFRAAEKIDHSRYPTLRLVGY